MTTDRLLQVVKEAKASDIAKGTGPQRNPRKSYHEVEGIDVEPDVEVKSAAQPDLPEVLLEIADDLMDDAQRPATMGNLAWAFRRLARELEKGS
jgi:hypothetical protein